MGQAELRSRCGLAEGCAHFPAKWAADNTVLLSGSPHPTALLHGQGLCPAPGEKKQSVCGCWGHGVLGQVLDCSYKCVSRVKTCVVWPECFVFLRLSRVCKTDGRISFLLLSLFCLLNCKPVRLGTVS